MRTWILAAAAAASLGAGLMLTPASAAPAVPSAVAAPDTAVKAQMMTPRERRMMRHQRMERRTMRRDHRMERRRTERRMMHRRMNRM